MGSLSAETVVTLETRAQVMQSFLLLGPRNPTASVILLPGGRGNLDLNGRSIGRGENNFLVRTRAAFEKHGFQVAVLDSPSDRKPAGMTGRFRTSAKHVADIDMVARYLLAQANVPVWLVGTSRGTESAAHAAIHCSEPIAGLVLTSPISEATRNGGTVVGLQLGALTIPVLIVAHREDRCDLTPASGAERIKSALTRSPRVDILYVDGGHQSRSKPCDALSTHGFLGIEGNVVDAIAAFIKAKESK